MREGGDGAEKGLRGEFVGDCHELATNIITKRGRLSYESLMCVDWRSVDGYSIYLHKGRHCSVW